MLYQFARPLLFALDAEAAHDLTLASLKLLAGTPLAPYCRADQGDPVQVMGLEFPNRVGLAAGLDKNGDCIDALAAWVSASSRSAPSRRGRSRATRSRACSGCPRRRRIINRMGFNNHGVDALIANVRGAKLQGHPRHQHRQELRHADRARRRRLPGLPQQVYAYASYVTVNISSPNTKNLRQLQGGDELDALLGALKACTGRTGRTARPLRAAGAEDRARPRRRADRRHRRRAAPAPHRRRHRHQHHAVARRRRRAPAAWRETGGLSGAPLLEHSTEVVRGAGDALWPAKCRSSASAASCAAPDARAKLEAGASLVQVYSGLIYRGPALVRRQCATRAEVSMAGSAGCPATFPLIPRDITPASRSGHLQSVDRVVTQWLRMQGAPRSEWSFPSHRGATPQPGPLGDDPEGSTSLARIAVLRHLDWDHPACGVAPCTAGRTSRARPRIEGE